MKIVIINSDIRKYISLYFLHNHEIELSFRADTHKQFEYLFEIDKDFQLICCYGSVYNNKYNFYKNCKVIKCNNSENNTFVKFKFDHVKEISDNDILTIMRKQKLIKINENT